MFPRPHRRTVHGHPLRRGCVALLGALLLAAAFATPGQSAALAAESVPDFRIIVHPEGPAREVDRRFLAQAFLKNVSQWRGGETIRPVDLRANSRTREKFSGAVVRRPVAAVKNYWQQRIFSGRGVPPPEVESDEDVVRYVLKHRGGVGYVSGRADVGRARVLVVHYD
jgi:hypothetical protein